MSRYEYGLKVDELVAIDVHTHANISGRDPPDPCSVLQDEQMAKYFKSGKPRFSARKRIRSGNTPDRNSE